MTSGWKRGNLPAGSSRALAFVIVVPALLTSFMDCVGRPKANADTASASDASRSATPEEIAAMPLTRVPVRQARRLEQRNIAEIHPSTQQTATLPEEASSGSNSDEVRESVMPNGVARKVEPNRPRNGRYREVMIAQGDGEGVTSIRWRPCIYGVDYPLPCYLDKYARENSWVYAWRK